MGYATGVSESVHHLARYRLRQGGVILESTVLFYNLFGKNENRRKRGRDRSFKKKVGDEFFKM